MITEKEKPLKFPQGPQPATKAATLLLTGTDLKPWADTTLAWGPTPGASGPRNPRQAGLLKARNEKVGAPQGCRPQAGHGTNPRPRCPLEGAGEIREAAGLPGGGEGGPTLRRHVGATRQLRLSPGP